MPKLYLIAFALLLCASAGSVVSLVREAHQANELSASRNQLDAALTDARARIQTLSAKLEALSAAQQAAQAAQTAAPPPPVTVPRPAVPVHRAVVKRAAPRPKPVEDPRWRQMQAQLAENHQQIAKTQEDLERTSEEFQGKLSSTRDELDGSIARTHGEVVALQKRGERNYYEFQIARSKQFQHVGPLSLSLRKADTKHRYFDVSVIVDDATMDKKHVNLFEPLWVSLADRPQPIELVVNRIDKDRISGYLSEPKYKNSDLGTVPPPAAAQPVLKQR